MIPRRSTVAAAAAGAGFPVPVVVGARFALEPGRGRSAVPVRPALVGAVAGVLGVLAAFTFSAGVSDAAAHPARQIGEGGVIEDRGNGRIHLLPDIGKRVRGGALGSLSFFNEAQHLADPNLVRGLGQAIAALGAAAPAR